MADHDRRQGGARHGESEGAVRRGVLRRLRPGWLWLPAAPVLLWLAGALYLPILAPALAPLARWLIALALVALTGLSLAAHGLAHALAARRLGADLPDQIQIGPLGDPAQQWPPAARAGHEALAALAGPGASVALAGIAALVWRAQLAPALDAAALFVALANGGLAAINFAPGYPLDGGRLLRLALQGAMRRPERAAQAAGAVLACGLLAWAGAVATTRSRLSGETGAALAVLAALLLAALVRRPHPGAAAPTSGRPRLRLAAATLLGLSLLSAPVSLLPLPYGLYAPGGAVPVAPMVDVPGMPPTPTRGALLLTTVIEQAPIIVAQWIAGQVDPAITLLPAEQVVPPNRTPQELVAVSANQLSESQVTATLVALHLAGYAAAITGDGARVLAVIAESPSRGLLRPGDRITVLDGAPVRGVADILAALDGRDMREPVAATVVRGGQTLQLQLQLLAPAAPGGPPRLGLALETSGLAVDSAVAVHIRPQGIIGGPSAGLMFALAIYDRLTPGDLTGDRRIAGTGTVDSDGVVGPIGGVAQKVAAAERTGAQIFLVPQENAAEARLVARRIRIIVVGSVAEGVAALRALPAGQ